MGTQNHGRDQVLKGWDLNQWQPGEGDSKSTLGRKEGTGLLEEGWEKEEVGNPKRQECTLCPKCALTHPKQQHIGCAQRSEALLKHMGEGSTGSE